MLRLVGLLVRLVCVEVCDEEDVGVVVVSVVLDDDDDDVVVDGGGGIGVVVVVVLPLFFVTSYYSQHCVHPSPITLLPTSPLRKITTPTTTTPVTSSTTTTTIITRQLPPQSTHTIAHRKAHSMEIIIHPPDRLHLPLHHPHQSSNEPHPNHPPNLLQQLYFPSYLPM